MEQQNTGGGGAATEQDWLEVTKEQVISALKSEKKQSQKLTKFKTKLEERFKDLAKEKIRLVKEKNQLEQQMVEMESHRFENDREIDILDNFVKHVLQKDYALSKDESGNFNLDKLKQLYTQIKKGKGQNVQEDNQAIRNLIPEIDPKDELISVLQEESQGLKQKLMQLTEKNVKTIKDFEDQKKELVAYYMTKVESSEKEISRLKQIDFDRSEQLGLDMIQALKTGKVLDSASQQTGTSGITSPDGSSSILSPKAKNLTPSKNQSFSEDSDRKLHQQEAKITDLQERLTFANETIAQMTTQIEELQQANAQSSNRLKHKNNLDVSEDNSALNVDQMSDFDKDSQSTNKLDMAYDDDDPAELLKLKLDEMEQQKYELIDEMDISRQKACNMLLKKEMQEQKLKLILSKFEQYLKTQQKLTQEAINEIGQVTEDELDQLSEKERQIEEDMDRVKTLEQLLFTVMNSNKSNGIDDISPISQTFQNLQQQIVVKQQSVLSAESDGKPLDTEVERQLKTKLEYIGNVLLKYLETTFADTNKKQELVNKELRTIENVLLTELQVSFEQQKKIETMIENKQKKSIWNKAKGKAAILKPKSTK